MCSCLYTMNTVDLLLNRLHAMRHHIPNCHTRPFLNRRRVGRRVVGGGAEGTGVLEKSVPIHV